MISLILRAIITGSVLNTVSTTINCKLARQFCADDKVCQSIATIVPRLCGQEIVACSTVTVTKCQAALRTLVAFPYFQPTCLCKEPRLDPECNTYRNLIFDHPCFTTKKKDKDPYPVDALPTCEYALDACRRETSCSHLYDDYLAACDSDNGSCRMQDSAVCYRSWTALRMTPVFGCMCPNLNEQRCQRVYSTVHDNPCVESLLSRHQHRYQSSDSRHDTHRHLHRLLHPPPPSPPARTHVTPTPPLMPPGHSSDAVSVDVLSGAVDAAGNVSKEDQQDRPPPAADVMMTPLNNGSLVRQGGRGSDMHRTLYGAEDEQLQMNQIVHLQHPRTSYDIVSDGVAAEAEVYQSSCHLARDHCMHDSTCRSKLQPVLNTCNINACSRKACMQRLRNFYSSAEPNMTTDVAFCVCRRNPSGGDQCLVAMQQLHPICAQRAESGAAPSCAALAESCRRRADGGACRHLLEQYEQACAVDSLTQRCAGPPVDCRLAVMALLGTQLRTSCSCRALQAAALYECRSWRALLWSNPCVDEAQRSFHRQRLVSQVLLQETTVVVSATRPPPVVHRPRPAPATARPPQLATMPPWRPRATSPRVTTALPTSTAGSPSWGRQHANSPPPATSAPGQHCVSRKQGRLDDRIDVGSGIRYYRLDESADKFSVEKDCSELCLCHAPGRLVCNVLQCVEQTGCQSSMAMYPHGSAGLLPFREGCICYQGDFVCMRPPADQYTLPFGVFLFLGFSSKDESILQPHTHQTVKHDAVRQLEKLLAASMSANGESFQDWPCKIHVLQFFELTENIIIQAKLDEVEESYNQSISPELLALEKDKCSHPLRDISFMVNNREPEILSHPLLSVFKMADVETFLPADSSAHARVLLSTQFLLYFCCALVSLRLLA